MRPKDGNALHLRGLLMLQLEKFAEAGELLKRAAVSKSGDSKVFNDLGNVLVKLLDGDGAVQAYSRAIALDPTNVDAYTNIGLLVKNSYPTQGENALRTALKLDPTARNARLGLASLLRETDRSQEALQELAALVRQNPEDWEIHNQLGRCFYEMKQMEQAIECFKRAILLQPRAGEPLTNLTAVLIGLDRMSEALTLIDEAIRNDPGSAPAHNNRGIILKTMGKMGDAEASYRKAINIMPGFTDAYVNLGNILSDGDRPQEALECFEKLRTIAPNNQQLKYNICFPQFQTGAIEQGWMGYEGRFLAGKTNPPRLNFNVPRWDGTPAPDKTLLIWREQGIGDELAFATIIPDVIPHVGKIIYESEPRFIELFRRSMPEIEVREESFTGQYIEMTEPDYDLEIPLASLALHFRKKLDSFPDPSKTLSLRPDLLKKWADRLNQRCGNSVKIGVAWRSGLFTTIRNNFVDMSSFGYWSALSEITEDVKFINLQYGDFHQEINAAKKEFNINVEYWDDLDLKNDLEDVFAIIANLDIVFTPTTALAHMSGILGIPTAVLAFCSYWPLMGTGQNPFYPSQEYFLAGVIRRPGGRTKMETTCQEACSWIEETVRKTQTQNKN